MNVIRRIVATKVTRDRANVVTVPCNRICIRNTALIYPSATSGQKGGGNGNSEFLHVKMIAKRDEALVALVGHADTSDPMNACLMQRSRRLTHRGSTGAHIINEHNSWWDW